MINKYKKRYITNTMKIKTIIYIFSKTNRHLVIVLFNIIIVI